MRSLRSLYPRARETRLAINSPELKKGRGPFFKAAGLNFIYLQLLFLALFSYIFGALYLQTTHTHNVHVVFVDYDGGAIGRAVRNAYASLQGKAFPSLIERLPSEYSSSSDLVRAVCKTRYWGALYITAGASNRLSQALRGGAAASAYNPNNTMTYIWNEALYGPTVDSAIAVNLQLLSQAARVAYSTGGGTGDVSSVSGLAALRVFANPWQLQSINIQPTTQGSRAIYNTVVIILILIQEFFYLGTINGLYAQFKIYARVDPYRIIIVRNLISLTYTLIGSLCVVAAIWAFKSGWNINGYQFVLSWMALWLFAHSNFLTLDVFTIWLPTPFVPMALVSWIIFNVTSTILPFIVSPGFYRIGYLFPAHEVYQVLIDIWSRGCNPQLHYALPILFAWEVAAFVLSALGVFRRCHYATIGEEIHEQACKERLDTAVAFEMEKMREMKKQPKPTTATPEEQLRESPSEKSEEADEEGTLRGQLAVALDKVTTRQQQAEGKWASECNFGPTFSLAFSREDDKQ